MKTLLAPKTFSPIEVLETRIAPALLVNGANLLGGVGNPTTGEMSVGGDSVTLIKVPAGQAIIWYSNGDIEGISVGPGAVLEIYGNVDGDIVANLHANGQLSDSDADATNGRDGRLLLPNNIQGIRTFPLSNEKGDIMNVITGGSIQGLNIQGRAEGFYAGDGVFNARS